MKTLRTTFYSYKGGVGRTLALLNVGALLAANGRKVLAVDLDLEAPGFGLSELTRGKNSAPGVSDFLHDRFNGGERPLLECCYQATDALGAIGETFWLMPAGTMPAWLGSIIPDIYAEPESAAAQLFLLLIDEIGQSLAPDFILFDSRTGRADISGVALLELPQVIVAMAGLNEQNVAGLETVLDEIRSHGAHRPDTLMMLALGPVPRAGDLGASSGSMDLEELLAMAGRAEEFTSHSPFDRPRTGEEFLVARLAAVNARLLLPIRKEFMENCRERFPDLADRDLLHLLPYDPLVPITDELQVTREGPLVRAYAKLADAIARARPNDPGLPHLIGRPGPLMAL